MNFNPDNFNSIIIVREWGVLWAREAQDRKTYWRSIGEAYAQKWKLGSAAT